jgi:hypothetical protein
MIPSLNFDAATGLPGWSIAREKTHLWRVRGAAEQHDSMKDLLAEVVVS